jgi:hypothetical protein
VRQLFAPSGCPESRRGVLIMGRAGRNKPGCSRDGQANRDNLVPIACTVCVEIQVCGTRAQRRYIVKWESAQKPCAITFGPRKPKHPTPVSMEPSAAGSCSAQSSFLRFLQFCLAAGSLLPSVGDAHVEIRDVFVLAKLFVACRY